MPAARSTRWKYELWTGFLGYACVTVTSLYLVLTLYNTVQAGTSCIHALCDHSVYAVAQALHTVAGVTAGRVDCVYLVDCWRCTLAVAADVVAVLLAVPGEFVPLLADAVFATRADQADADPSGA